MGDSKIIDSVVYQPDDRTCQAACIAKVLGTQDVYAIRADLEALGTPGDPAVMGRYLKGRVREYRYLENGSLNDLIEALADGATVITHGYFTGAGHVITVVGSEPADDEGPERFIVDDPWGEFDFPSASYDNQASGDNLRYSALGIYSYCVASWTFRTAQQLYADGVVSHAQSGAWLHCIKN